MKRLQLFVVGAMCCLFYFHAPAQAPPISRNVLPEKKRLFDKLPEKVGISNLWIEKLFSGTDTGVVKIPIAGNRFFEGRIMEKLRVNANVVNMNIKSTNYDGALFSVSQITDERGVRYNGRIVSIKYGDLYILTQEPTGLYLQKRKQSVVITE